MGAYTRGDRRGGATFQYRSADACSRTQNRTHKTIRKPVRTPPLRQTHREPAHGHTPGSSGCASHCCALRRCCLFPPRRRQTWPRRFSEGSARRTRRPWTCRQQPPIHSSCWVVRGAVSCRAVVVVARAWACAVGGVDPQTVQSFGDDAAGPEVWCCVGGQWWRRWQWRRRKRRGLRLWWRRRWWWWRVGVAVVAVAAAEVIRGTAGAAVRGVAQEHWPHTTIPHHTSSPQARTTPRRWPIRWPLRRPGTRQSSSSDAQSAPQQRCGGIRTQDQGR